MDAHDAVSKLKELALELGRTPSRREFERVRHGRTMIEQFGGYALLVQSAGLEPKRTQKITNSIFEKDLAQHLEVYREIETTPEMSREPWPKIAILSDIHFPFENQKVIKAFLDFIAEFKPEHIVLNGDVWDFFSHSKYPRTHNLFTPKEEERIARERNEKLWIDIKTRCPNAKCIQNLGNHSVRPLKRILETVPTMEHWIENYFEQLLTFDGVETNFDIRHEIEIAGILIFHGYRSQLGAHRDYTLRNCVNGHTHRGGAVFRQVRGEVIWELNSGVAGDPMSKGLSYTPQKITDWTPGFGAIDRYGPRFIPVP